MNDNLPRLDQTQLSKLTQKVASMDEEGNVPTIKKHPDTEYQELARKEPTLKEKIAQLEQELNVSTVAPMQRTEVTSEVSYKDSMGNETFYVKNISGRHVLLSDLNINKIKIGESVDLLQHATLEQLKNSRDLRRVLSGYGIEKELQRLTEEEYFNELTILRENRKKNEIHRKQEDLRLAALQANQDQQANLMPHDRTFTPAPKKIRPAVESKLGKLALRKDSDPQNARLAMTSREFITWIQNEPMSHAEIEFIMGHPAVSDDHNIRVALLEKKNRTPISED
jgi:hypothetical protein